MTAREVTGRPWAQLVLFLADAVHTDPAATVLAGFRPGECEVCGGSDDPETLIPAVHAVTGGALVEAHPECAAHRGYVPAGPS